MRSTSHIRCLVVVTSLAGLGVGCIPSQPTVQAEPGRHRVALALVVDNAQDRSVADVPDALAEAVAAELEERNLATQRVPHTTLASAFESRRLTAHRLATLAASAEGANVLCLVETYPRFFSQLNGRYRWTVLVKVTLASAGQLDSAVSGEYELPVFLTYAFEGASHALERVAPSLTRSMSSLVDDFVGGLASEPTAGGEGTVDAAEGTAGAHRDAIYFVLVDRFANGDPSNDGPAEPRSAAGWHGGDLQGVLDHLDHLEALGVGTVWLSPVFSVREEPFHGHGAFHGYWVDDLGRVAPRFGSTALLRTLADALHARGMRLVLDMVLNHVGYETPLVAERPEWFHRNGSIVDWDDPVQLTDYDVHGLPDLAQERDDVYAHLLARSIEWIDHVAPDGFRLDAVKHIPISFWQRYNRDIAARAGEGFMLLGEALDGNPTTYGPLFREGGFTHLFDFPLYFAMVDVFCRDQPLGRIASVLYADRDLPDPSRLVTLLDNHDLPRLESVCRRDRQRIESALAFQLTARGVPSLTYGLEAGLLGETEPANRGDMDFERDHPNRGLVTELLALRRGHPALRTGVTKVYALDEDSMLAARIGKSAAVVIAVNRGTSPWAAQIPPDLATGIARPLRAGVTVDGTQIAVAPGSVALVAITAPHRDGFEPVRAAALRDVREPTMVEVPVHWVGGAATTGDVRLGGSGRELGDWDPARGVALIPDGPDRVGTVRLPLGGTFAYKLARPSGSSSAAAPSFVSGDNAYVFVTRDASITWPR